MTSDDENVCSCKRHTVVCCVRLFLAITLALRLTTMSLDQYSNDAVGLANQITLKTFGCCFGATTVNSDFV